MTSPESPLDPRRITELEERLTQQQHLLDQLNEVVLGQSRQLERLGREIASYVRAVERLAENASGDDFPHEKPPHY
jgi:SlyX protein